MVISKVSIGLATALSAVSVGALTITTGGAGASIGPDVVISELMIDPRDVYDSRGEWIELVNRGDAPAQLAGWRITDGRAENAVLPALTIAPGEHLVLARAGDSYVNGGVEADWVYGNQIVLYNASDRVILSNAEGAEEDRVDWYPEHGLSVPTGRSLARARLDASSGDPASWCASTTIMTRGDLGSPGRPNVCDTPAEPIVITEVLQNPRRASDDTGEWFELHNPGVAPVDLGGWTVKDDDHDRFTVPTGVMVPAGGYAVLGRSATGNGGVTLDHAYGEAMRLQNDWDELALADERGILVDRVAWDNGRTFPDPDGATMSLLDPGLDNAAAPAWCVATSSWATGDRGTPGGPSWCTPPGSNPIVVTEVMFDPETPSSERSSEWFEVANLGTEPVDLTGWTITAGDYKVHTIGGLVVAPGDLAVLAATGDAVANGEVTADYVYGTKPELPLYNTTGRIILKAPTGAIVDRVEWSAAKGFPIPSGASITLGFTTSSNELGANWCASNARWAAGDFGTPGIVGGCEAPPAPAPITISEIMRNPAAVGDSAGEWFEVHNAGTEPVDMTGWSLGDGTSDRHVIAGTLVVPAGGHLVLGRTTDLTVNGGTPVAYGYGNGFVLSNDADRIVLRDRHDQTVDDVRWAKGDGFPRPNGASVARIPDGWCVSGPQFGIGDLGTPGVANDCTPLPHVDVVISEINTDPRVVSDTVGEWIEVTNRSDVTVDLNGWRLRDDDVDTYTIGSSVVVAPGASVVLGRELSPALNGGADVDHSYDTSFPLSNDEDEITLIDANRIWVDRVAWTADRRLPALPGASAALADLGTDNSDPANWCTSATPFATLGERGTPGAVNDCPIDDNDDDSSTTTTTTTTTTAAPPESSTSTSTTTSTTTTSTTTSTTTTTTTTTTLPPTTLPPTALPLSSGFGLLATGGVTCGNGLQLSGSSMQIAGGIRSNGNVMVQGSSVTVTGPISYAGTPNVGNKVASAGLVHSPTPVGAGFAWTVADFAPGGTFSFEPGYVAHAGNWTAHSAAAGIHYVAGNVTISASSVDLRGVTIVATGTVTVSGSSAQLAPARADLPTVLAGGGSCTSAAINVSGSSVTWSGVLAAPNGLAQVNGSRPRGGSVTAAAIQISGSDIVIS